METRNLAEGKSRLSMEEDEDGQDLRGDYSCAYSLSGTRVNVRGSLEIQAWNTKLSVEPRQMGWLAPSAQVGVSQAEDAGAFPTS